MANPQNKPSNSSITIGSITIGMLIGAGIGLFADNMIMGLAIGVAIGIALSIEQQSRHRNRVRDDDGEDA